MNPLSLVLLAGISSSLVMARLETNMIRDTCNRKWELILSHDKDGNVTYGVKAELLNLAMTGRYVKASVYMPDHLLQLPSDNVNRRGDEICVQSLRALSHNGSHVDTEFPRLFFMVCTTGHVSERDMRTSSVFRASTDWFVKDICADFEPIYSNYLDGSMKWTSSSEKLHEAAKRMGLVGAMRDKPYVFPLHNVMLDPETGEVNGQNTLHVGQKYMDNYVTFHDVPYYWHSFWSTLGHRDNARWSLQGHKPYTHNADKATVDWYADTCWRLIYSHDETGFDLHGTIDDLIDHISRGHRVRVRYDDVNVEVSNLRVNNKVVTAQVLSEVSRVGGYEMNRNYISKDTRAIIDLVHTTSKVNSYEYPIGQAIKEVKPPVRRAMEWMVDTRPWTTVRKTGSSDGASYQPHLLSNAVMEGASIRLKIAHNTSDEAFFIQANNVRVDFLTDVVYAQALDCVSDKESRLVNEYELPLKAYNKFYQISSDGSMQISSWYFGSDTFKADEIDSSAEITWFANL